MDIRLGRIQQCVLATREANSILGCRNRSAVRWREVIIPIYSAPVRPHLDTAFSFGPLKTRMTVANWRKFSGGPQSGGLEHLPGGGRLREQGLFSLRRRLCWGGPSRSIAPTCDKVIKKMEPGTSQWCSVGEQ